MCPGTTSTRNGPPGTASNASAVPHQDDCIAGSASSFQTVSGRAAIVTSRVRTCVSIALSIVLPLLSFGFCLQRLEPLAPERLEELPELDEARRTGSVEPSRAVPPFVHEPRLLQDREVLGDRRPRHLEMGRDLPGRELLRAHELEDLPPPRLGDRLE